jgi:hypothetical protein
MSLMPNNTSPSSIRVVMAGRSAGHTSCNTRRFVLGSDDESYRALQHPSAQTETWMAGTVPGHDVFGCIDPSIGRTT